VDKEDDFYLLLNVIVNIRILLEQDSAALLKLPTDKALLDDSEFRHYVELYAKVIGI
jgi:hypothetical protein